jgi:hypothetical protein
MELTVFCHLQKSPIMQLKVIVRQSSLVSTFLFFSFLAFSQSENCTNGSDDDGDGLIDCFDPDCTCSGQCADFYYTTCNADCYYVPPCGQITLGIQWSASVETGTYSPVVAGDMDADGIPDVVTTRVEAPDLYILDGATGATKVHVMAPTVWPGGTAPAIADLDHDGFGEVVIVGFDRLLYCYEHDGTLKYTSAIQVGYHPRYRYAVPNIADFDHDGWAEVNIGNQVFNGQTGALLAEGGATVSSGENPARVLTGLSFASPVAIDALPDAFCPDCEGLEIVAGNQVLSVNLVTGIVVPVVTADAPMTDGFTSVADYDLDGDLDAIVQGRNSTNNFNTIYCWDIQTPTIMRQFQLLNNWQEGASRVNVADLNGDGALEVSFVSYPWLYALDNNFNIMWTRFVNDASSITCSSIFDFCGDGSSDIVYRDQDFLRVIEGATGTVNWEDHCLSATHIEAPLILDVDADGQTEIVIQCGTNGSTNTGTVVAYEAIGTPGIASRKVWNQHAYFNTNINDDLSVPRYQQNHNIVGDSLVLNTFLNQYFNPTFPTPDGSIVFQQVYCNLDSLEITLEICNNGDNILPAQTPVSAYRGNPQTTPAVWVQSWPIGVDIPLGQCRNILFSMPRIANDTVFVVLNDDHSLATPFTLNQDFPVTAIGECGFNNNIVQFYYPYLPGTISLGPDTALCDHTTIALDVSGNDLLYWEWNIGASTSQLIVQSPGTYAVSVTDVCNVIQSDTVVITIDSSTVVNIGLDQSICKGEAVAFEAGGFDYYQWTAAATLSCSSCSNVVVSAPSSTEVVLEAGFFNGCLNRDTALLTVYDTFNYAIDTVICRGRTVWWNGQVIPPDSSVVFYMQTVHGCDSTLLLRVIGTTIGTFNHVVDTSVCMGSTLSYLGFDLLGGVEKTFNLSAVTGCDSTVLVRVAPRDTFYVAQNNTICYGESLDVFGTPQSTGGLYVGIFTAQNGCDSTHLIQLTVLPQIQLEVDASTACFGETTGALRVNVLNGVDPLQFSWNFSGSNLPLVDDVPAGDYTVTVTDGNDCTETADVIVEAYPAYSFDIKEDSVSCFGLADGSILINSPDAALTYALNEGSFTQNIHFEQLVAGNYEVLAQDIYGCQDTALVSIFQPPLLSVSLPADISVQLGISVPLSVGLSGLPLAQWIWSDTAFLSCLTCADPVSQTPLRTVQYKLTVIDENGCTATDEMLLTVDPVFDVYIPNAMGGDGENSHFDISFGPAIKRIKYLGVFNRWGSVVHEVRDAFPGDAGVAWDGRFNGSFVNPGVYVWLVELELVDGRLIQRKGDLTVVR